MKSLLSKLDTVLITAGALMLLAFFIARGWSHAQSQSAIVSFENARAIAHLDTEVSANIGLAHDSIPADEALPAPAVVLSNASDFSLQTADPDYSLWSELRIEEYRQSLLADDDDPRAVLSIKKLNIKVPVYNGASDLNLNRGVARIIGTGLIDEVGNLGIAGHRDGFFRGLKDIKIGEMIELQTLKETTEYVVTSIAIVDPSEVGVLGPTENSTKRRTARHWWRLSLLKTPSGDREQGGCGRTEPVWTPSSVSIKPYAVSISGSRLHRAREPMMCLPRTSRACSCCDLLRRLVQAASRTY